MEDVCTKGQLVTGEILEPQISALAQSEGIAAKAVGLGDPAPKSKKPRKARATSKFVILTPELTDGKLTFPSIVAARKAIQHPGTFYIACLREEVSVETTVPQPVTKVTVKRVVR